MPYQKYRELAQWGKIDTQVFKRHWRNANAERMDKFEIPQAVKAYGAVVHDPNDPSFFKQFEATPQNPPPLHPALKKPHIMVRLYIKCVIFKSFSFRIIHCTMLISAFCLKVLNLFLME